MIDLFASRPQSRVLLGVIENGTSKMAWWEPRPPTPEDLRAHLEGRRLLGLVPDKVVHLDLDRTGLKDLRPLVEVLNALQIPAYAGPGNTRGSKVWIFLEEPQEDLEALARGLARMAKLLLGEEHAVEGYPNGRHGLFLPLFGALNGQPRPLYEAWSKASVFLPFRPRYASPEALRRLVKAVPFLEVATQRRPSGPRHEAAMALLNLAHRAGVLGEARVLLGSAAVFRVWGLEDTRNIEAWREELDRLAEAAASEEYAHKRGLPFLKEVGLDPKPLGDLLGAVRSQEPWPEPEPLELEPAPVPEFDATLLLPEPIGPWVEDTAQRMAAPPEFLGTAALVAVAGVVGNRVLVVPDLEANPEWLEAPNLWGLLVGEPGSKKSPSLEAAFAPLHALEGSLAERNRARRLEWELERRNRKKGDPVTEEDLSPPTEEALLVHDITAEKLGDLLEQNPFGLVSYQDELLGLIATWERPEKAGERQFYLKLWNGLSAHTIRRIQRGSHYIPVTTLSLIGGAQPGPLARYIRKAAEGWDNDGLLVRFQLLVRADPPEYRREVRAPSRWTELYAKKLEALWGIRPQGLPQRELRPGVVRPYMAFSPEAQALYLEWLEATAKEARNPATPTLKKSLLEKQAGLVPKLALLLHLVESPEPGPLIPELPTLRAIDLANLYRAHTLAVWGEALSPEVEGAVVLAKRILDRTKTKSAFNYERFTPRDILRAGWKGLKTREAVMEALRVLEERGWVRREGEAWVPNPRLWEGRNAD